MSARISVEELRPAGARGAAVRTRRAAGAESARFRLEPRDAGGILDLGIEGLLARLGPCLALALLFWVPFRQITEVLGISGLEGFTADLLALVWNALELVPIGATVSVVASLVGDALEDRRTPLSAGILRGLARAPGAVVLMLLTHFLTLPLMLLCVAPYFIALWLTWAAVPIFVLEGEELLSPAERLRARRSVFAWLASIPRRLARSLARSLALSTGAATLGRWLLLGVVGQLVLGGVLELGAVGLTHPAARAWLQESLGLGGGASDFALGAVASLFTALAACLRAALMVAFYLDLRVRREGWDLELALARAHGARPAAEAS